MVACETCTWEVPNQCLAGSTTKRVTPQNHSLSLGCLGLWLFLAEVKLHTWEGPGPDPTWSRVQELVDSFPFLAYIICWVPKMVTSTGQPIWIWFFKISHPYLIPPFKILVPLSGNGVVNLVAWHGHPPCSCRLWLQKKMVCLNLVEPNWQTEVATVSYCQLFGVYPSCTHPGLYFHA